MQQIKFIIFPLLLFAICSHLFPQSAETDSLLNEINKAKNKKRLELIYQYSLLFEDDKELYEIANWLEREAILQNNKKYLADSYAHKTRYFMCEENLDSLLYYSSRIDELSRNDDEIKNLSFLGHYYAAIFYIHRGYNSLAIHKLNDLLNKQQQIEKHEGVIYQALGTAYLATNRYDLAENSYRKSLEIMRSNFVEPIVCLPIYYGLIDALNGLNKYDEALALCAKVENIINKNKNELTQSASNVLLYRFYIQYANIYIEMKDVSKVKYYLDKIEALPMSGAYDIVLYEKKCVYAYYYYLIEDYNKALNYLELTLEYLKGLNRSGSFTDQLTKLHISILQKLGRYDEASLVQQKYLNYKDSIYQENVPLQLTQLSMNYELEKVQLKQQNHKTQLSKSRLINIGLALILCFGGFLFYMSRRNMKALKAKNKILYRQSLDVKKYIDFIKGHRLEKIKETENFDKKTSLFEQLDAFMQESDIYKDSDITREVVAKALNTNRQYLADAIKAEMNMTFMDYVNEYRLNFARNQLILDESTPVNNIIQEAGFISNATFYRLFKEKFGMTPSELRQAKNELETEIITTQS